MTATAKPSSVPTGDLLQRVAEYAAEAAKATRQRDDCIRDLRAQGETLRTIAAAVGLSASAVAKIAAR